MVALEKKTLGKSGMVQELAARMNLAVG